MGAQQGIKEFGSRFKLDSHHGIERFGILFVLVSGLLLAAMISAGVSAKANSSLRLSSQAMYTTMFTTSKTGLGGNVTGVYISPDRTRSLLLMQFADTGSMPLQGNDYQAFLTGSDLEYKQQPLKASELGGTTIVFGSTGYIGFLLQSDQPMPEQIFNVTFRVSAELVYTKSTPALSAELQGDQSFIDYDQWRVYYNPGAAGATVSQALGASSFDAGAFYAETLVADQEAEIREKLEDSLLTMRAQLARIDEYETQLATTSSIDGEFLVSPREGEPQETLLPIVGDAVTGEPATDDAPSTLRLDTDWVAPGGYSFDWRSGSVQQGYLDKLVPVGQKYGSWLTEHRNEASTYKGPTFNTGDIVWTLADGTPLAESKSTATVLAPLIEVQSKLSGAYDAYWQMKNEYQVTLPNELLELEVTLRNVETAQSANTTRESLLLY